MLYVPEGCAHGYLALEDGSEVIYPVTTPYQPGAERGVRWNDPAIRHRVAVDPAVVISAKDERWPDYQPAQS